MTVSFDYNRMVRANDIFLPNHNLLELLASRLAPNSHLIEHRKYRDAKRAYIDKLHEHNKDNSLQPWIDFQEWLLERKLCPKLVKAPKSMLYYNDYWEWQYNPGYCYKYRMTPLDERIRRSKERKRFHNHINLQIAKAAQIFNLSTYIPKSTPIEDRLIISSSYYGNAEQLLFITYRYEEASDVELNFLHQSETRECL